MVTRLRAILIVSRSTDQFTRQPLIIGTSISGWRVNWSVLRETTILTDRATPRLYFVGGNAFTIHLYALAKTNRRLEYIIIAAQSFWSNTKRIRNSEAEFRILQ